MNYYKHHIGDYSSATEHLSWDEDQAYTRLMRVYYRDERPLPVDRKKIYRLARAEKPPQRIAIDTVLEEFFELDEDGYHNSRCDREIQADRTFIEKQRANGQASAAKRSHSHGTNGGSTTVPTVVQPDDHHHTNGGSTVGQPPTPTPTPKLEGEGIAVNGHARKPDAKPKTRRVSRVPETFDPDPTLALAELPDIDLDREVQKFRDWEFKTPRSDWAAVWRNWIGSAKDTGKYAKRSQSKGWM